MLRTSVLLGLALLVGLAMATVDVERDITNENGAARSKRWWGGWGGLGYGGFGGYGLGMGYPYYGFYGKRDTEPMERDIEIDTKDTTVHKPMKRSAPGHIEHIEKTDEKFIKEREMDTTASRNKRWWGGWGLGGLGYGYGLGFGYPYYGFYGKRDVEVTKRNNFNNNNSGGGWGDNFNNNNGRSIDSETVESVEKRFPGQQRPMQMMGKRDVVSKRYYGYRGGNNFNNNNAGGGGWGNNFNNNNGKRSIENSFDTEYVKKRDNFNNNNSGGGWGDNFNNNNGKRSADSIDVSKRYYGYRGGNNFNNNNAGGGGWGNNFNNNNGK